MTRAPRIAVLPYATRWPAGLARVPLDRLDWPLGRPAGLAGQVGDLGPDDHLILFPTAALLLAPHRGVRARLTPMFVEPRAIQGGLARLAGALHGRFFALLTCDDRLIAAAPNAIRYTYGGTWVPEWEGVDTVKDRGLSLIASAKRALPGHRLRHAVAARLAAEGIAADVMGGGYRSFGAKAEGLARYRFTIAIENSRQRGYFTEKLIDAILCRTIPIYWGAPDIADHFDPAGMVVCETADDLIAAARHVTADAYAARLPAALANIPRAAGFADPLGNAARAVLGAATAAATG
ncbi:MAG: glycosyltransferase family 10 domain-containing protein [Gemmobacter sp.]